jgi:hypothetical protein
MASVTGITPWGELPGQRLNWSEYRPRAERALLIEDALGLSPTSCV